MELFITEALALNRSVRAPHLISHPDKGGRTVAHYAAIREEDGDDVLFKLLKKHGANFEAIDHGGNKPATLAAKAGRKKSKELLEEALVK